LENIFFSTSGGERGEKFSNYPDKGGGGGEFSIKLRPAIVDWKEKRKERKGNSTFKEEKGKEGDAYSYKLARANVKVKKEGKILS